MKIPLVRLFAAMVLVLVLNAGSYAFYFPGMPGSGVPQVQRLAPPNVPPLQPRIPPIEHPMPPPVQPPERLPPIVEPQAVPEPGTFALALIGAGLMGCGLFWKWR